MLSQRQITCTDTRIAYGHGQNSRPGKGKWTGAYLPACICCRQMHQHGLIPHNSVVFHVHAGRETPSVACVVQPGNPGGFQKVFFGREEVAIPVQGTVQEAVKAYPRADVFINFASFRRYQIPDTLASEVMLWYLRDCSETGRAALAQQCLPHTAGESPPKAVVSQMLPECWFRLGFVLHQSNRRSGQTHPCRVYFAAICRHALVVLPHSHWRRLTCLYALRKGHRTMPLLTWQQSRRHARNASDVLPGGLLWRSAYESSMDALRQPTIRVVAIIAEGVPEGDTKKLIAYARANNKILIGPATVGGVQVCRGVSSPDIEI